MNHAFKRSHVPIISSFLASRLSGCRAYRVDTSVETCGRGTITAPLAEKPRLSRHVTLSPRTREVGIPFLIHRSKSTQNKKIAFLSSHAIHQSPQVIQLHEFPRVRALLAAPTGEPLGLPLVSFTLG